MPFTPITIPGYTPQKPPASGGDTPGFKPITIPGYSGGAQANTIKPPLPILTPGKGGIVNAAKDVAVGAGKDLVQGGRNVANLFQRGGQAVIAGATGQNIKNVEQNTGIKSIDNNTPQGQTVNAMLQPKSVGEKTGATISQVGQIASGFEGGVAEDLLAKGKSVAGKVSDYFNTEKLFGKGAADIKAAKADTIAQEFKSGARTLADTGEKIKSGISSFIKNGKSTLNAVFDKLPKDISVKSSDIINAVNNGMQKVVGGLEKSSGATLSDMKDVLTKTKFSPDEQKIVSNLVKKVNDWIKVPENTSPRGLAELRRVIYDQFAREDGSLSDQVVSKVNNELKNLITSSSKEFGPALKNATENIDKAEQISKQFLDKNGNIVESKLNTFIKKLDDPALAAGTKNLFKNVMGEAGADITKELQGFDNYKLLQKIEAGGKGLVGKAKTVAKVLATGGGITYAYDKIKNILKK